MSIDPVCRMTVDERTAAARTLRDGRSYYCCSEHCLTKFAADPARYVDAAPAGPAVESGARAVGEDASDVQLLAGLRDWF